MSLGAMGSREEGQSTGVSLTFGIPCSEMLLWGWAIPVQARAALGPLWCQLLGASSCFMSCSTRMSQAPPCPFVTCQFLS